ncbi:hypothetical protein MJG53_000151 [Ovis ammon polii x Ovis aries]|nr:hypothetical protein MJG53_000151 [Ovis ammon polii x Ovis aries]
MRDPFAAYSEENPGRFRRIARGGALHRKGLRPRHRRERKPKRSPSNSHGDWPFLRPPERVPEVPTLSRQHLPQLEKIQEILPFRKFGDIPVSTLEQARGSRPHPEEPRFRLVALDEESFSCLDGKEFWAFASHLRRTRSPQERQEEIQRRGIIPRVPQMSQSFPEDPVFPALPRLSRRGSTHNRVDVGQPCGKASWESLVGKPRGKATDPLILLMGSVTLLLQLWRKRHVHAPIRNEDLLPW